jgi:hypothetical protein
MAKVIEFPKLNDRRKDENFETVIWAIKVNKGTPFEGWVVCHSTDLGAVKFVRE